MAALAEDILLHLKESGDATVSSLHLAQVFDTDHQKVVGAIKSLQSAGNVRGYHLMISSEILHEYEEWVFHSKIIILRD